jgi:hypothetical protein
MAARSARTACQAGHPGQPVTSTSDFKLVYNVAMAVDRTALALTMLLIVGCGSSKVSPMQAGTGGAAKSGTSGPSGTGGVTGNNSTGGAVGTGGDAGALGTDAGTAPSNGGVIDGGNAIGIGSAGGSSGSGGTTYTGGVSGTGGAPACVAKDDPNAPFVSFQRAADPAPVATGGPIAGGTYFLTALTYHGGKQVQTPCELSQVHEVLRFSTTSDTEGIMNSTLVTMYSDGTGRTVYPSEIAYQSKGTLLSGRWTCSGQYDYGQIYSATSTRVLFIRGPADTDCDTGVTLVETYDKQP